MDVQTIFVILAFLLLPLFCFREAWKGWRTGAVDKVVKNARKPVYVYRHADPVQYWSYLFLYTGFGFLFTGIIIYLLFYRLSIYYPFKIENSYYYDIRNKCCFAFWFHFFVNSFTEYPSFNA